MSRGEIIDKWHRVCVDCGKSVHVSAFQGPTIYECEECGGIEFTRDKSKVKA